MMNGTDLNATLFGDDFKWGVATAAFQVEGSCGVHGKSPSIWDTFSHTKGKINEGEHADNACEFYERYAEDIGHLKSLGIPNFRFSLAWSRILPEGIGPVNRHGIDFYNRVIDLCIAEGITPWVTLYHWDLPQLLEDRGGWTSRDMVSWFSEYAQVCAHHFGDRVKHWMVLNEPMVFTGLGYFMGLHAPGKRGLGNFLAATHHAVLCNAAGGRILKKTVPDAEVGTTFSCSHIDPLSSSDRDARAAKRVDAILNRLFLEPALGMGYPIADVRALRKIKKYILPGDEVLMKFGFDFIGVQNYTREVVKSSWITLYIGARIVKAENRNVPITGMKTEVYPDGIYHLLKKYDAYPGVRKIIVTENGAAFNDTVLNGEVNDEARTQFLQDYLAAVLRAKQEGCKIDGYFVWTLTDNFEWAEGYRQRFGLIYVDFATQQRIIKASGKWYSAFIGAQALGFKL